MTSRNLSGDGGTPLTPGNSGMNKMSSPNSLETREKVARIIDPGSWRYYDGFHVRHGEEHARAYVADSLSKADQILALPEFAGIMCSSGAATAAAPSGATEAQHSAGFKRPEYLTGAEMVFVGGSLNLDFRKKRGHLAFTDEHLEPVREYDEDGVWDGYLVKLPNSELVAIRDFLNKWLPPAESGDAVGQSPSAGNGGEAVVLRDEPPSPAKDRDTGEEGSSGADRATPDATRQGDTGPQHSAGWLVVPEEPTEAMLRAGASDDTPRTATNSLDRMYETVRLIYRAMLAAAPSPERQP